VEQTNGVLFSASEFIQQKTALFANLPYSIGSLLGLFAVAVMMFLVCKNLKCETVKVNEQ